MSIPTIQRIKSKMFIAAARKATHILEGEYAAVTQGRSMDFDDLREYVYGDDIKDIDWKASARSTTPLVRRYKAERKIPVTFIIDTGLGMEAFTEKDIAKKEVSANVLGVLGYIAINHSDTVGVLYGDETRNTLLPYRETESHLNWLIRTVYTDTSFESNPGDIYSQIRFAAKTIRTKGISVIISGEFPVTQELVNLVNKLKITQEVLWIIVKDGNPLDRNDANLTVEDIETNQFIPDYIKKSNHLTKWFANEENQRTQTVFNYMRVNKISYTTISSTEEIVPKLLQMLQRRKRRAGRSATRTSTV